MSDRNAPAESRDANAACSVGRPILRFLTCGSVDDGKSTLVGRLLYDCQLIADDTFASIETDSRTFGTTGGIDFALLVDGLQAEREQGITIDVAYRYFATARRKFIVADTPGHEQYTRNMATGASRSELAVILVDARKGLLPQTHRHTCIIKLLGIRHVVLAVNKMDAVDYHQDVFERIRENFERFAKSLGLEGIVAIPVSAARGDNLSGRSAAMPWYQGPPLLEHLETIDVSRPAAAESLRLPVQWVCRPSQDFRGFAGTIASGTLKAGDEIVVLPSARQSKIARILTPGGDVQEAAAGKSLMVTLTGEVDVGRGDMICAAHDRPEVTDQFQASLVWMSDKHLLKGRPLVIRAGTQSAIAQISEIKYKLNVESLEHVACKDLELNEI